MIAITILKLTKSINLMPLSILLPILYHNPGPSNSQVEGPQNEYPYKPRKTENNSRSEAVSIRGGKKLSQQMRENERETRAARKKRN